MSIFKISISQLTQYPCKQAHPKENVVFLGTQLPQEGQLNTTLGLNKGLEDIGAISPPLSEAELVDIEASEIEFSSGGGKIYDNIDNFINDLHSARTRFQRKKRK